MINQNTKIYVAGHNGMVGSSCCRILKSEGFHNIVTKSSKELDLRDGKKIYDFLSKEKPTVIVNAAAKVGGILANDTYPYEFLMDNMLIQNNLIKTAHQLNIPKFIFLGSSCIYPKLSKQPIKEEYLLSDKLEETNQWYAIAKISGVMLINALRKQYKRDYVSLMPTNLYGPNDNFELKSSHVLPALIRKFHDQKINNHSPVTLWGSGKPMREFLHVDDLSMAIILAIKKSLSDHIYNIGSGHEISIWNLAKKIQKVVGHKGEVVWDSNMPDGTPRKLIDSRKFSELGWKPIYNLDKGIEDTYRWFLNNLSQQHSS